MALTLERSAFDLTFGLQTSIQNVHKSRQELLRADKQSDLRTRYRKRTATGAYLVLVATRSAGAALIVRLAYQIGVVRSFVWCAPLRLSQQPK
jgi:hypothetical protein